MAFLPALLAGAGEAGAAGAAAEGAGAAGLGLGTLPTTYGAAGLTTSLAAPEVAAGTGMGAATSSLLPEALANAQKIAGLASMFQTPPIPGSNIQSSEPQLMPRRRMRMF